jgi:DNA-binding NarL/FixJ family response regulator
MLVVDDQPVVIEGIRRALETVPDVEIVAIARTVAAGRRELERDDIDVALIEVRLPDGPGTALIRAATARGSPATLVFSETDHPTYVAAAISSGAHGFLLKTASLSELIGAIHAVGEGAMAYSDEQRMQAERDGVLLSDRERAIVGLLMASRSNDEIAAGLGLSRKTIEANLARMFERLGALSRTELAVRAEREGWLDV